MKFPKLPFLLVFVLFPIAVFAQADRDAGIALFNKGDYDKSISILKRSAKSETDGLANYYLGLAYIKKNKLKEASAALERSVNLQPTIAKFKVALAFAYLTRNDRRVWQTIQDAIKLDPKIPEAHFVLASYNLYLGSYEAAYEAASKAIELDPKFAVAYRVRSDALIASFTLLGGAIIRPRNAKNELLFEATENMQKYVDLAPPGEDTNFYRSYLESLGFFSEYYRGRAEKTAAGNASNAAGSSNSTPYKVLSQPKAMYTDQARQAGVQGSIRLLIGLGADGKVNHILILKPLGFGLDQQAVRAARSIKFEPATIDGKAVASVITREYTFTIY